MIPSEDPQFALMEDGLGEHSGAFKRKILLFLFHGTVATIGGLFIGFVILGRLKVRPISAYSHVITLLTDVPYSPAFWLPTGAMGFALNRHFRDRSASWVGVAGLAFLGLLILGSIPGYVGSGYELAHHSSFENYIWGELFSLDSKTCGANECLGKLLFTVPVLDSVAYSIGAFLGLCSVKAVSV